MPPIVVRLDTARRRHDAQPARRQWDRWIAVASIAVAATFVILAAVSLGAPATVRLGWWLPVHLLLAGGAATAIAGIMPFFSAAVASVPAAAPALRIGGVAAIAVGAAGIVLARLVDGGALVTGLPGFVAGAIYLVGVGLVALATLLPLRIALGSRRRVLAGSYGMALLCLAVGAGLGTLALGGWGPVIEAWASSKPAHGWLNMFGFLSLVVGATLLHLAPTIAGTRIERDATSRLVLGALMIGPLVAALGFLVATDLLVMLGATIEVVGAVALLRYAVLVLRRRGRWTTDLEWHRFTLTSIVAAVCWFVVGTGLAAWLAWTGGASTRGWDLPLLLAPLALGWAAQVLIGSWSHLVPAIGPGSPIVHARQRHLLGLGATVRSITWQVAVALLAVGLPTGWGVPLVVGGVALFVLVAVATGLLVASLARLRGQG